MAPRVRLYGLRHLRDGQAAEDLAQDVLMRTLEALRAGRLREPEELASFVLGMCRMTVMDLRRGVQRKQRLLEQCGAGLAMAAEPAMPEFDQERLTRRVEGLCEWVSACAMGRANLPFHAGEGGVVLQESTTHAKAAPSERMRVRMVSVDEAGAERVLGEYTFHHRRSLPGPGAW